MRTAAIARPPNLHRISFCHLAVAEEIVRRGHECVAVDRDAVDAVVVLDADVVARPAWSEDDVLDAHGLDIDLELLDPRAPRLGR